MKRPFTVSYTHLDVYKRQHWAITILPKQMPSMKRSRPTWRARGSVRDLEEKACLLYTSYRRDIRPVTAVLPTALERAALHALPGSALDVYKRQGLDSEVAYSIPKYRRLPLCGGQMAYNISIVERLLQPMGHRRCV